MIANIHAASNDPLADRMHTLTQDLRCLVCQNESLADSHAPLALDLKREIRTMMEAGQSDEQIRAFLTQRYGDFVNYQPPLRASTVLLWAGPLLILLAGATVVLRHVRRSATPQDESDSTSAAGPSQGAKAPSGGSATGEAVEHGGTPS